MAMGRGAGPIQCWRCHGFGHTQTRCPNEKKPIDYTPMCRYCSGEGHFNEDFPKKKADSGKGKGPVESSNYVETQAHPTPRERKSTEEIDIVQMLAETEVTLDIGTLLRCSPTYRKQFYNEYIKKPRKARDKKRQEKDVQGLIQSITTQIDSNAPSVAVEIKGYAVPGAQLDSGAAINLMTEYMMTALGLTHMEETPMSLRMADQTQVKPAGLLKNVSTVVGGLEFSVDYLIVRPRTSEGTFSILLGWPWLVQAKCVHDWRTGFITIGPKSDRVQIQVSSNSSDKRTTREEELEKKTKEKAKQEKARVRFALNTKPYKKLLQDGFNLRLSKNQDTKIREYQNPLFYKDDSDQELLEWLASTGEAECYTMHIDPKEAETNDHLEGKILKRGTTLELTTIIQARHMKGKAEDLEVEPRDIWLWTKESNV
ncbi:hypothetical protein KP509_30G004300 [Ceratopteris richardii]|uniref:CCHC-type domain-containing protein n=1 Tax=Ceratopteris richardii TaxID=49495 RepID=A0A8T2R1H4_CERRI|nr:hypothetical protein KP509_30G004300 [Ceratopteris richardii]